MHARSARPASQASLPVSFAAVVLGALVSACASAPNASSGTAAPADPCAPATYPAKPASAARALYVAAACTGDGSTPASPVGTIAQAVALATPGTAILVAPGTYAENVRLEQPNTWLLGANEGASGEAPPVVIAAPGPYAVAVRAGGAGVVVRGLHVRDPIGVGIWVAGAGTEAAPVRVESSRVDGAAITAAQPYGYGLMSVGSKGLVVADTVITGSAGVGFLIGESSVVVTRSRVAGSAKGGLRVEASNAEKGHRGVVLTGNTFEGNAEFGVGLFRRY